MHAPLPKLPAKMPAERSRSRRERRSGATRRPALHVVMPGLEVAREVPRKGETVTAFLRRTGWAWKDREYGWQFRKGLPTVLEVNGEPLLRRHWSRKKIAANDNLRFVSFPLGGGSGGTKQVLGLVALVALAAFAAPLAGAALGAFGLSSSTALIGSLTLGQAVAGGILLGGALLVNALTAPRPGATNDPNATTDQIYSVQAQGNAAKLGQPLAVRYGREKVYPDFAAAPWSEFVGNDQYLNVLLSHGMGLFEYEQLLIGDTPFWTPGGGVAPAFSSATVEFYEPGEQVTLFPTNVTQSDEVTGQQLPNNGAFLGPFVANPAGTEAYQLAVDYVFPAGCFETDDEGNTLGFGVGILIERQAVDDAGTPSGDWILMQSTTLTYANRSPIRGTVLAGCPDGRWRVRFRRTNGVPADNKGAAELIWAGLRAYLRGDRSFAEVSTIAIRIKASQSTQGSYKFGAIATRKLPVWDTDTSTFITQATRNPFWAFLDAVSNAQYGSGHPISKVDFNAILSHATAADERGDCFDYSFDAAVAVPEAFDTILTPARSRHYWLGDTVSVVRDEWRDVPSMLLTDREIVRGSTQVNWTMLGEDDPDAVVVEYIDEDTWRPASVQYPPESFEFMAIKPETKRINGIVNRDHAYREAAFYYLQSIYRRENVQIGTEYEGRAITFGQTLRLQSELPQAYGQAGAVTANDDGVLTLDPAPIWTEEETFIRLRRANGKYFGPVSVAKGDTDDLAVLDPEDLETVESQQGITLAGVLAREDGGEWPSFDLGTADNQSRVVKVLSGQPNGNLCTLSLVLDDERVHATDLGTPPVLPTPQYPEDERAPTVSFLTANFRQGIAEPILDASWWPSEGARYYTAEVSYNYHLTADPEWIQVYEGIDNKFSVVVDRAQLRLRVQATAQRSGAYSYVDVEAPTIVIAPGTVAPSSLEAGLRDYVTTYRQAEAAQVAATLSEIYGLIAEIDAASDENKATLRRDLIRTADRVTASYKEEIAVSVGPNSAIASALQELRASVDDVESSFSARFIAAVTPDGALAAYELQAVAEAAFAGLTLVAFDDGMGGALGEVWFDVDKYKVGKSGVAGFVPMYVIDTSGDSPKVVQNIDLIIDGGITTQKLASGSVTTDILAAGSVDATIIKQNGVSLDNLIKGAATHQVFVATSASGYTSSIVTVGSTNFDVQGGSVTVFWTASINEVIPGSFGDLQTNRAALYVDGSLKKAWVWNHSADARTYNSGSGTYTSRLQTSFTVSWTVGGLSAGNHTIQIRLGGSGGRPVFDAGQMTVIDLRK